MVWMSMIVPKGFDQAPEEFGLTNKTGTELCRQGNIPQSQVDEELPILQGFGLNPAVGQCPSRGYNVNPAAKGIDGWASNFYIKPSEFSNNLK